MRTLGELLDSSDGRRFLESRGVWADEEAFVDRQRPPLRSGLSVVAGLDPGRFPVYSAHQLLPDYRPSVTSKIGAIGGLGRRHPGVAPVLVWLDLDRAGADKSTSGLHLSGRGGTLHVRLASRRHDEKETRFVPVDRAALEESLRRMRAWARQHGPAVAERSARLEEAMVAAEPASLARLNLALTAFLVREQLGVDAPSVLVSELAARGVLTELIDEVVDAIDDVVTVFNRAIEGLVAADVDPQVRPLGPEYLPLHYSCERDDRRITLAHERRGADHFAVATCVCGNGYRFHLGTTTLSIAELAQTGRWSPDVTLPLYLGALTSGVVAGRSSALYGLVLNEVSEKVLARRPVPMLIPEDLSSVLTGGPAETKEGPAGLLAAYLMGG